MPGRNASLLADSPRWFYAAPGQLRAPWRMLLFGGSLFLVQGIAESLLGPLFALVSRAVGEPVPAYQWVMLVSVFAAIVVSLRSVDNAPWAAIGCGDGAWSSGNLARGACIGAAAMVGAVAPLLLLGAMRFDAAPVLDGSHSLVRAWSATSFRLLLLLAPAALWEELVFRGYFWHIAQEAGGVRLARWSTAVAFSAMHLVNPGAGVQTLLAVLLAGLCLGLIRERCASLPAAWGAHLAWNWGLAALLHAPVSGLPFAAPGYRAVFSGPGWLSGGVWGPEGGITAVLVMLAALLRWQRQPGNKSFWTRTGRDTGAQRAASATQANAIRS